jgi:hypothetical protein
MPQGFDGKHGGEVFPLSMRVVGRSLGWAASRNAGKTPGRDAGGNLLDCGILAPSRASASRASTLRVHLTLPLCVVPRSLSSAAITLPRNALHSASGIGRLSNYAWSSSVGTMSSCSRLRGINTWPMVVMYFTVNTLNASHSSSGFIFSSASRGHSVANAYGRLKGDIS